MKKIENRSQQKKKKKHRKTNKQKITKNTIYFHLVEFFPGINIRNSIRHNLLHQHVKEKNHGIIIMGSY